MKDLSIKTARRVRWLVLSIPAMICALAYEPRKHPWRYVFDYMFLSAEKRYSKTAYYINHYFQVSRKNSEYLVDCKEFVLAIPENLFNRQEFMVSFLAVYFDIIYAGSVRFPIPLIVAEGPYEKKGVTLNSGDYVIDAGANMGVFSAHASRKIGSQGKVFAFEPIADVANIIRSSAKANTPPLDNINVVQKALGKSSGETTFNYSIENLMGSHRTAVGSNMKVEEISIDDYVRENAIKKINFIKMDIEGAERYALEGAKETIAKWKPCLAICIYHLPDDPAVIRAIIENIRNDYSFYLTSHKLYAW